MGCANNPMARVQRAFQWGKTRSLVLPRLRPRGWAASGIVVLLCVFSLVSLSSIVAAQEEEKPKKNVYVPKDFPTIQAAIDAAVSGWVIYSNLEESPGFVIEGNRDLGIGFQRDNPTVITGSISIIRGFDIRLGAFDARGGIRVERSERVRIYDGNVVGGAFFDQSQRCEISNCSFLDVDSIGVVIRRGGVDVRGNTFRNISPGPSVIAEKGGGDITGNTFEDLGGRAIELQDAGYSNVVGNKIKNVRGAAIFADGFNGQIRNNNINGVRADAGGNSRGICIRHERLPGEGVRISENTISGFRDVGILCTTSSVSTGDDWNEATWSGNTITGGDFGIVLREGSRGSIVKDSIAGTKRAGISILDSTRNILILKASLRDNEGLGIMLQAQPLGPERQVTYGKEVTVSQTSITRKPGTPGRGGGILASNTFGQLDAVRIQGAGSDPGISVIDGSRMDGLSADVYVNVIREGQGHGLVVDNSRYGGLTQVHKNKGHGVMLVNNAYAQMYRLTSNDNEGTGLIVRDGSHIFGALSVRGNKTGGVHFDLDRREVFDSLNLMNNSPYNLKLTGGIQFNTSASHIGGRAGFTSVENPVGIILGEGCSWKDYLSTISVEGGTNILVKSGAFAEPGCREISRGDVGVHVESGGRARLSCTIKGNKVGVWADPGSEVEIHRRTPPVLVGNETDIKGEVRWYGGNIMDLLARFVRRPR
jgi:hypothetical protein